MAGSCDPAIQIFSFMNQLPSVITMPNPLLRQQLDSVTEFDDSLHELAKTMRQVMRLYDGVGLAANQIGVNTRLFVYEITEPFDIDDQHVTRLPFMAVANPVITVLDPGMVVLDEGCLSLPSLYGPVARAKKIRLDGQNLFGEPLSIELQHYPARVVQHEVDHLNGILFLDRLTDPTKLYRKTD